MIRAWCATKVTEATPGNFENPSYHGRFKGQIDGDRVKLHSSLPTDGNTSYTTFTGSLFGGTISGDVALSECVEAPARAAEIQFGAKLLFLKNASLL
jgi:hypothetical protein